MQLLFEIFLICFAFIVTASLGWTTFRFLARMPVLVLAIVLARLPTFLITVHETDGPVVKLYQHRFIYSNPTTPVDRLSGVPATSSAELGGFTVLFVVWVFVSYAIFYKDHRTNRWLDTRFEQIRRPRAMRVSS